MHFDFSVQQSWEGRFCEGCVAQSCRKLRAKFVQNCVHFRFRTSEEGCADLLQICREFEHFGQFYANTHFPMPLLQISDLCICWVVAGSSRGATGLSMVCVTAISHNQFCMGLLGSFRKFRFLQVPRSMTNFMARLWDMCLEAFGCRDVRWAAAGIYFQNSCRSRFSGVYLVFEVFRTPGVPIRKIIVYTGVLPCLGPSWPQNLQIRISFCSRSGCWSFLGLFTCLVLQARISFCSVSDKSGTSLFLPCSDENAVAHGVQPQAVAGRPWCVSPGKVVKLGAWWGAAEARGRLERSTLKRLHYYVVLKPGDARRRWVWGSRRAGLQWLETSVGKINVFLYVSVA